MIYFTSDLHFSHEKIIKHTRRPFLSVEQMDRRLVANWNRLVTPADQVYILGDVTMKGGQVANQFLRQLHGKKYLIRGNHDRFVDDASFERGLLEWVRDYYELEQGNFRFMLFHYPITEWNGQRHGTVHLHGHIHADLSYNLQMMEQGLRKYDVGVDANNFTPVSMDELIGNFA